MDNQTININENDLNVRNGATVKMFATGALTGGATKTITHNGNMTKYIIVVRDINDTNNAMVDLVRPTPTNPKRAIDIQSAIDIAYPGLIIYIIGE